ncbi:hypothetical protein PHYSODRAFT_323793 [Phytophthora sojae]|uniref:Uncharacterized protein n=1 Tax=Phytophthora sojae (strain P6497) TaxID=1094619 RepID=G4YNJ7_PHYSP|nr:hypothetical protein PHYSODRAFT_323793 [Phytophthora sojae]EGZ30396.1 hypothetical protein PHYSODRAFT_323793 [Phytophthora sojae]|eukprot:XP_009517671.1 hypothetical protein PHYSODRAFT_323793 [Phytophthora sojae]
MTPATIIKLPAARLAGSSSPNGPTRYGLSLLSTHSSNHSELLDVELGDPGATAAGRGAPAEGARGVLQLVADQVAAGTRRLLRSKEKAARGGARLDGVNVARAPGSRQCREGVHAVAGESQTRTRRMQNEDTKPEDKDSDSVVGKMQIKSHRTPKLFIKVSTFRGPPCGTPCTGYVKEKRKSDT